MYVCIFHLFTFQIQFCEKLEFITLAQAQYYIFFSQGSSAIMNFVYLYFIFQLAIFHAYIYVCMYIHI